MKLVRESVGLFLGLFFISISSVTLGHAAFADPACLDDQSNPLPVMNQQVLTWLQTSKDHFLARALVQGTLISQYADHTGHAHFSVDLNGDGKGDLEVIYQYDFGALPHLSPGMKVTACGDYITDKQGSPNGGIIHWIHCNPGDRDNGRHPHGFLDINGTVYGFQAPAGQPACHLN